ncbi:unnamed protein product, partial [Ixodes pacificus]
QELQKSRQLEDSMRKLDIEMKRTDELLYQMIPKAVADQLRSGETSVNTCQYFDSVTILFSDVVSFTEICSRITPMEVVSMLNSMYSLFDELTEKHGVYKVETIGDAYMVVAGAPEPEPNHSEKVCDMALDMIKVIGDLKDPSTGKSLRIRVGVHSGAVVAGVVGLKMPRYCLFGDSVNTASRMESTSEALRVHISQKTKDLLDETKWQILDRGTVDRRKLPPPQGKGSMKTYWLQGKKGPGQRKLPETQTVQAKRQESRRRKSAAGSRSVYSPVTYEEIAKHSPSNTPPPYAGLAPESAKEAARDPVKPVVVPLANGSPKRRATGVSPLGAPESNGRPVARKAAWTELELKVPTQMPVVTAPQPSFAQLGLQPCQHCTHCHSYHQRKVGDAASLDSRDKTGCWNTSSQTARGVHAGQSAAASGASCSLL